MSKRKYTITDEKDLPVGLNENVRRALHKAKAHIYPMGSRETSVATVKEDTDYDYLVYVGLQGYSELAYVLWEEGFEIDGDDKYKTSNFISYRKDLANIIITSDKAHFDKYVIATDVCRAVQVEDKELRLHIYNALTKPKGTVASLPGSLYITTVPNPDSPWREQWFLSRILKPRPLSIGAIPLTPWAE